ncbi:esterase/lipase family protein [Bacillus sp. 2205SS5-2]|uniref:esterase/lipase family protein n=1 Tax=Bacillus sp. 2205SS5-2 TaxID=3109031 RepID=UPI003005C717
MKKLKLVSSLFLLVFLLLPSSMIASENANASVPSPAGVTDTPGTWFVGAIPNNVNPNKSPIVFVQGLHGNAKEWWKETVYYGKNDMYQHAYLNGYRTAFVQLEDSTGGDAADMWHNGKMLANMLEEIYDYFGEKVTIVAHSKGGVDTQAALVHYGAWPFVDDVITLSTPHSGSPLADLAYSWYAGWLAELIERTDDGTYSMQTGEMEKFRSLIDNNENAFKNNYYTASGTGWGPLFSALWFGGLYLGGDNDGLVPVWSTQLPYGKHFYSGGDNINHDNIRTGSSSFKQIDAILSGSATSFSPTSFSSESVDSNYIPEQLLRGDSLASNIAVTEMIPVESGNHQVVFQVMTSGSDVNLTLTSPKGKQYSQSSKQYTNYVDKDYFKDAFIQTFKINKPEAGKWKISMESKKEDAYFIVTNFQGSKSLNMTWSELERKAKDTKNFTKQKDSSSKKIKIDKKIKNKKPNQTKREMEHSVDFNNVMESTTSNVTYEIIGTTKNGEKYYRTAVKSYYNY